MFLLMIHTAMIKDPNAEAGWLPDPDLDLVAFNEKRNFRCQLDPELLDGPSLISFIHRNGIGHVKGYFWAFMEKGKRELTVITDPIHPGQPW